MKDLFTNSKVRCDLSFFGKVNSKNLGIMLSYHDFRWCKPIYDDNELFAMLSLEIMQSGLSWQTVLKKESDFRLAFDGFNVELVANYDENKIKKLMNNNKIIRNERKIKSIVDNAKLLLKFKDIFGSFNNYIWSFTNGLIIDHKLTSLKHMPVKDELSIKISDSLRKYGFKFVGPIIVYSYLQAIGVINDHCEYCEFR